MSSTPERQRCFTRSRLRHFERQASPVESRARIVGILAAAGWAFFVPAQAYSVILMPTAVGVFVFWFLVWQVVKSEHAPGPLRCLAYGALIGITATGIATILFIVPLLLAALLAKAIICSGATLALARPQRRRGVAFRWPRGGHVALLDS